MIERAHGAAARRRLRQRLRPHRDQLDDRRARPRRPPRRVRQRRPGGPRAGSARSAGRCPTLEVEIRDADGDAGRRRASGARSGCAASRSSGEYLGRGACPTTAGSPPATPATSTSDGFLFVDGRLDDVIVRGGENLSPGEIEDVLRRPPRRRRRRRGRRARHRVGREGRRRRGRRRGRRGRREDELRRGSASACARPRPPSTSRSATSCRTTRPASCCAVSCAFGSPSSSAPERGCDEGCGLRHQRRAGRLPVHRRARTGRAPRRAGDRGEGDRHPGW